MQVLGFDIGGANIKASDADGRTSSVVFPMWTQYLQLPDALTSLAAEICPKPDMVAATMTAELADCFVTKAEGVEYVIGALEQAFPNVPIRIWMTSGEFAEPDDARELPMLIAAANWHALATWAGRAVPDGPAVLFDVGSTTTDVIPILDGFPVPRGRNDLDRLMNGELVYSGASRTPVCAVVSFVPLRKKRCPVAAEVFATMADVMLVAGLQEEDETNTDTADGRPFTRAASLNRLAHMVCCDSTELSELELQQIAEHILHEQRQQLCNALQTVLATLSDAMQKAPGRSAKTSDKPVVMFSGSGAQIAREAIELLGDSGFSTQMYLPEMFSRPISESASAFAVARLCHDRCRDDLLQESVF